MKCGTRTWSGFTLLELIIAVAIVGILAAIALPSYSDSVRKARRSDGTATLLKAQIDQEKWRGNHTAYTSSLQGTNCGTSTATGLCWTSNTSPEGYYTIALSGAGSTGYTATATAIGSQAQDKEDGVSCATLTLTVNASNPQGARTPDECW